MRTGTLFLVLLAALTHGAVPAEAQKTYVVSREGIYYLNPIMGSSKFFYYSEKASIADAVITGDGLTAYATINSVVQVFDVITDTVTGRFGLTPWGYSADRLAIGNNGTRLYTLSGDLDGSVVVIINIARNSSGGRVNKAIGSIKLRDYVPDPGSGTAIRAYDNAATNTHLLAVCTSSGDVLLFDTSGGVITLRASTHSSNLSDIVFSKDGQKLYIILSSPLPLEVNNLLIADTATLSIMNGIHVGLASDSLARAALQPNGARLFVVGESDCPAWPDCSAPYYGRIFVVDTATEAMTRRIALPVYSIPTAIAAVDLGAAHGGLKLFVTDSAYGYMWIYSYWTNILDFANTDYGPKAVAVTEKNWQLP